MTQTDMKRQLTIKELAAYLPYGVKAQDCDTKEVREVTLNHRTYNLETVGYNHLLGEGLLPKLHLLCLRPLSDLTKEIEQNGKRFRPIEYLNENKSVTIHPAVDTRGARVFFNDKTSNIRFWEYCVIEKLHEWHFDTFNLIPDGLAVDINTLDK